MAELVKKAQDELEFMPDVLRMASLAAEIRAIDLKALDVRGLTIVADCFVICSAASQPQFKAIYNAVKEGMKEIGVAPLHSEGELTGGWVILDYANIIFHIFREETREYYDLDGLWGDAPLLELESVL